MDKLSLFRDERIWRFITNFWTLAFIAFVVADFISHNAYDFLVAPMSVIYIGVLSLYVGTKEFDRWYEIHEGKRHPGEYFVLLWTLTIFGLMTVSFIYTGVGRISSEVVAVYIMVLSVFALTQKSKSLHREKLKKLKVAE
ncbi:MAG: hypothetical protein M1312_01430 [Patescibacteria group bacterium]|nr:hypothetical protein [Patescibacteria group bacterium]MDE2144707.1 hypothetical protein [Patescibacteria group bacterium]